MIRYTILLGVMLLAATQINAQCLANYKEALKVCEGTYLKHYEFNTNTNSSMQVILNEGTNYLLYLLNTSLDLKHYKLSYNTGSYAYPFISYDISNNYECYSLCPTKTGIYEITMHVDTNTTACALVGLFFQNSTSLTQQKYSQKDNPPGTVKVAENLFFDETEISNVSWREYKYWIKKNYGKESVEYQQVLPDTLVWRQKNAYNEPYVEYYQQHPAYAEYPVVGISYEQAIAYCKWRSDRVNELLHIKKNKKDYNSENNIGKAPEVFRYRLPTKDEWEKYAGVGYNESIKKKLAKNDYPYANFQSKITGKANSLGFINDSPDITAPVRSYWPNKAGLYNMFGNVAEMVSQKGFAKGGSWMHTESESTIKKDFKYSKPECWLGFRCVCEKVLD